MQVPSVTDRPASVSCPSREYFKEARVSKAKHLPPRSAIAIEKHLAGVIPRFQGVCEPAGVLNFIGSLAY